jgi:NAD-dependent SIR2 family protein deacetylase
MHLKYFVACLYIGLCIYSSALSVNMTGGFLLKSPPMISSQFLAEKIEKLMNTPSMEMKWSHTNKTTGASWALSFNHIQGKTSLKLQFVKELPSDLSEEEIQKFIKTTEDDQNLWTYSYGAPSEILNVKPQMPSSLEMSMGIVADPLVIEEEVRLPESTTVVGLAAYIKDKVVVFYTGAGISVAVVPTMPEIMTKLGLNADSREGKGLLFLLKKIFAEPESYIAPMDQFYRACFYGMPTPAHVVLSKLVCLKNWGLLTENLDFLHQRTGIEPLSHKPDWLKNNVTEGDLKKIDVVITIGLQSDESGFLGWYKKNNPNGKIAAINLRSPNYLGTQDYFLQGDAQALVPQIYEALR